MKVDDDFLPETEIIKYIDINNKTLFKNDLTNKSKIIEKIDIMGLTSPSLQTQIETLINDKKIIYEKIINKYRLFSDFIDMVHDFKICNFYFLKLIGDNKKNFPVGTLEEFKTLFDELCTISSTGIRSIRVDKSYVIQYELFKKLIEELKKLNLNIPELPEYEVLLKENNYNDYFIKKKDFFNWFRESGKGSPIGYKISANNYSVLDGCKQKPINMQPVPNYPKFWTQNVAGLFNVTVYPNSLNGKGDKGAKFVVNYVDKEKGVIIVTYKIGSRATLDNVLGIEYNENIFTKNLLNTQKKKNKGQNEKVFTQTIIKAAKRGKDGDDDDDDEQCILENSIDTTIEITNLKINGIDYFIQDLDKDKDMLELTMVFSKCIKTLCDKLVIERVQNGCKSPVTPDEDTTMFEFEDKHLHALFTIDSYVPYVGILEYLANNIDYCFPTFVKTKKGFKYLDMPTVGDDNKLLQEKFYYYNLLKEISEISNNKNNIISKNLNNTNFFFDNFNRKIGTGKKSDEWTKEDLWINIQYKMIKKHYEKWEEKKKFFLLKITKTVPEITNLINQRAGNFTDENKNDLIKQLLSLPDVPNMALELSEVIEESDEFTPLVLTENIEAIHDLLTFDMLTGITKEQKQKINEYSKPNLYKRGYRFTNGELIDIKLKNKIDLNKLEKELNNNIQKNNNLNLNAENETNLQTFDTFDNKFKKNYNINISIADNIRNIIDSYDDKIDDKITARYVALEYIKELKKEQELTDEEKIIINSIKNEFIAELIDSDSTNDEIELIGQHIGISKDFDKLKIGFYTIISKVNPKPEYNIENKTVILNINGTTTTTAINNIVDFYNSEEYEEDRKIKYIKQNKQLIIPLSIELIINLTYASLLKVDDIKILSNDKVRNKVMRERTITETSERTEKDVVQLKDTIIDDSYTNLVALCNNIEYITKDEYKNALIKSIQIEKEKNDKNFKEKYKEWSNNNFEGSNTIFTKVKNYTNDDNNSNKRKRIKKDNDIDYNNNNVDNILGIKRPIISPIISFPSKNSFPSKKYEKYEINEKIGFEGNEKMSLDNEDGNEDGNKGGTKRIKKYFSKKQNNKTKKKYTRKTSKKYSKQNKKNQKNRHTYKKNNN